MEKEKKSTSPLAIAIEHKIDGMHFEEDGERKKKKDECSKKTFSERIPISVHSFSRGSR